LTQARASIARHLGARPDEVVFTSGGTESIQLALRGYASAHPPGHLISSNVEHPAVAQTLALLEQQGWEITYLPVGSWGSVTPEQVRAALRPETRALVLMAANNETGVITDLPAMATIAQEARLFYFVDAVAALGRMPVTFLPGISAMAFSGHKIHAPHGAGILLLRRNIRIEPQILGGGQESKRRSGTENVPAIVALSEALSLATQRLPQAIARTTALRNQLEQRLRQELDIIVHGEGPRLCNTLHASFPDLDAETLLITLDQAGIAVSHGSACSAGALEPSQVLLSMGVSRALARSAIRFSLSHTTTAEEIEITIGEICRIARQLSKR
jgi:cysteine desulfurase